MRLSVPAGIQFGSGPASPDGGITDCHTGGPAVGVHRTGLSHAREQFQNAGSGATRTRNEFRHTGGITAVAGNYVAVVALFNTASGPRRAGRYIRAHHTIATRGQRTVVAAGIRVGSVAVIALFHTSSGSRVARCGVRAHQAVSAGGKRAVVVAAVGLDRVAVVACLAGVDNAVAARRAQTICTADTRTCTVAGPRSADAAGITGLRPVQESVSAHSLTPASRVAAVARRSVTVVAHFDAAARPARARDVRAEHTVATDSRRTIVSARIVIVAIGIVTLIGTVDDAVTASRQGARIAAAVGIDLVAVVARLAAVEHAVAAAGTQTIATADAGAGHIVATVTILTNPGLTVTAKTFNRTIRRTAVAVHCVAVVALLGTREEQTVAAHEQRAVALAEIGVDGIAVIALLGPAVRAREAVGGRAGNTVTACGKDAAVHARIVITSVGVVAIFFAELDETVAAPRRRTRIRTGVVVVGIGVVALLGPASGTGGARECGANKAVAASRRLTAVQTAVGVARVAVIADFRPSTRARRAGRPRTNQTVSTARQRAVVQTTVVLVGVAVVTLLHILSYAVATHRRTRVGEFQQRANRGHMSIALTGLQIDDAERRAGKIGTVVVIPQSIDIHGTTTLGDALEQPHSRTQDRTIKLIVSGTGRLGR